MSGGPPTTSPRRSLRGVPGIIARLLRIPIEPPSIPIGSGETIQSFNPDPGWISCRRIQIITKFSLVVFGFLFVTVLWQVLDGIGKSDSTSFMQGILVGLRDTTSYWGRAEIAVIVLAALSTIVRLLFLRLQYECIWYVVTARSLMIRRGIWVTRETSITYANIQNVTVRQGPLERFFKLSNIVVETAGGGGDSDGKDSEESESHVGLVEGVTNPEEIRSLIMARVRASRTAGLGDESQASVAPAERHRRRRGPDPTRTVQVLMQIRDELRGAHD